MKNNYQPYTQKNSANLIAISGTTRSGKAMLMNIISSFQKVEKGNVQIMMEQVYYLHQIKAISNQSAIYLMRKAISLLLFSFFTNSFFIIYFLLSFP